MASQPKYMAVQGAALIVAAALMSIGLLGFIPGATANVGELAWAGQHSGAMLFGVFVVSVLVNVFHLVLGGLGSLLGAIVGAASFLVLEEVLSHFTEHWRLIFGPFLVLVVLFGRGGLISLLPGGRKNG